MASEPPWTLANKRRAEVLDWIQNKRVDLDSNPVGKIGGLNAKIALVREYSNQVRDEVFQAMGLKTALLRESHLASDAYNDKLSEKMQDIRQMTPEQIKALPKTAEEREVFWRQGFKPLYDTKVEAERRVEEWDQFQKMLYTIYYSLRDTANDIQTQLNVIRQQYFSGEIELNHKAASIFDFLSPDARKLVSTGEVPLEILDDGGGVPEVKF